MGKRDLWDNEKEIVEPGYLTDLLGRKTIEVIESHRDKDTTFFLSLHFIAPQWPRDWPENQKESERLLAKPKADIKPLDGGLTEVFANRVKRSEKRREGKGCVRSGRLCWNPQNK